MLPLVLCTKRRPKQITLEETSFPRTLWKSVDTHCEIVGQISLNTCSVFAAWCFTATNLWASQNPLCFFLWLFIVRHSTCERDTRVPIAFGFKLLGNTRVILSFYKKVLCVISTNIFFHFQERIDFYFLYLCLNTWHFSTASVNLTLLNICCFSSQPTQFSCCFSSVARRHNKCKQCLCNI